MEGGGSSQIIQRVDKLHALVRQDDKAGIATLLKEGQTAVIVDKKLNGITALHLAASLGNAEVVELLVRLGNADIHARSDDCKDTPLHLAAVFGHEAVVEKLLQLGAVSDILVEDRNGDKPLHNAARSGKGKIIRRMLSMASNREACIFAKNGKLRTVLHYAAGSGNPTAVALLLETKQDLKEVRDRHGALPFHFAARSGDVESLKLLVPKDVNDADELGLTALHYAAWNGNVDAVKWLLEKKAILKAGPNTPLHLAAISRKKPERVSVVEAIMTSDPESWKLENKNGELAIGLAHEYGHGDVVKAFFRALRKSKSSAGEDIFTPTHATSKATLLHFAAAHGTKDDIEWLAPAVARGGKTVNDFLDNSERAPLHWAAIMGNRSTLKALAAHGADLKLVGNKGTHETPLFLALGADHLAFAEELLKCDKERTKNGLTTDQWMEGVDRWLMSYYGAKVELRQVKEELERDFKRLMASQNRTWLSASNGGAIDMYEEMPPVYLALHAKKLNIANFFQRLSSYEDAVNKKGKYTGRTALHWAVLLRRRDIVEQLCNEEPFKEKVRACEEDAQGISPVQYATERNMHDIESVLFKREAVKNYIDGLYRDRQYYVDTTNAILVCAALIASVTFAGWLQPPLGFADHHYNEDLPYVAIRQVQGMRIFWIFNSLSFFAAIGTVQAGVCGLMPLFVHIGRAVTYIRHALVVASILMSLSVVCVVAAFGAAGFVVLPPRFKFQSYMMATVMFGGLINAYLILWLQRFLVAPRLLLVWRRHLSGGQDQKRSAPPPDHAPLAEKVESPQQASTPRSSVDIQKPSFPWEDGIEEVIPRKSNRYH